MEHFCNISEKLFVELMENPLDYVFMGKGKLWVCERKVTIIGLKYVNIHRSFIDFRKLLDMKGKWVVDEEKKNCAWRFSEPVHCFISHFVYRCTSSPSFAPPTMPLRILITILGIIYLSAYAALGLFALAMAVLGWETMTLTILEICIEVFIFMRFYARKKQYFSAWTSSGLAGNRSMFTGEGNSLNEMQCCGGILACRYSYGW